MQAKYYRSTFSEKAYQDVGYPNPTTAWGAQYDEKCRQYPKVVDKVSTKVTRVQVEPEEEGQKPREYIVWDELEIRMNDLGNKNTVVRTNPGIYPILEPHYRWQWGENGNKEKVHDRHPKEFLAFYQEWNESTKKEINKYILKSQDFKRKLNPTQLSVQKQGDPFVITVENYNDFMEKSFEELYKPPNFEKRGNKTRTTAN